LGSDGWAYLVKKETREPVKEVEVEKEVFEKSPFNFDS